MNSTLYSHPDGFTLAFNDDALIAINDEGKIVSLPIGPLGLVELAAELNAIGNDGGNLAEQAGNAAGIDCLNELLATDNQGERIRIIQNAITGLQNTTHSERAAGGFAVALESVIERGLETLQ